jgi:hypothetical protein
MGWVVNATLRPLYPGKNTRYPLYRRLGGPQWRSGRVRIISPSLGFDPRTIQPVESRYTDPLCRTVQFRDNTSLVSRKYFCIFLKDIPRRFESYRFILRLLVVRVLVAWNLTHVFRKDIRLRYVTFSVSPSSCVVNKQIRNEPIYIRYFAEQLAVCRFGASTLVDIQWWPFACVDVLPDDTDKCKTLLCLFALPAERVALLSQLPLHSDILPAIIFPPLPSAPYIVKL